MGMGSLLIFTVYNLLAYYGTNPTLTNINVKFVKELSYPAITICNMSPYKQSAVNASPAMTSHLLHSSRLGVIMPPLNYSDPLYAELNHAFSDDWLDKVSFDIKDLFVVCVNKRVVVSCYDILTRKITQWGTCFTYNNYEKVETEGRVNGSMTGSATALTFYINIQQSEYVFNTNIAAGVKVYTLNIDRTIFIYILCDTGVHHRQMTDIILNNCPCPFRFVEQIVLSDL